jgi:DNA-binding CsgD family transcriptional regulator
MADCGNPNTDTLRATIREAIYRASVPAQRLVQVIELIDLCRVGNSLDSIKEVCNRLAILLKTDATVECCKDCCRDCNRVAASRNELTSIPSDTNWDVELYIDADAVRAYDSRTWVMSGNERIELAVSGHQLRICYFSDADQTGVCFMCAQERALNNIGFYLPLVYLLPHIYAMYKRIYQQTGCRRCAALPAPRESLTPRETDVLRWIAAGKTNWEISQILRLSERTVKFHLSNAFGKLNAVNRAQAVVKARESGALLDQLEEERSS